MEKAARPTYMFPHDVPSVPPLAGAHLVDLQRHGAAHAARGLEIHAPGAIEQPTDALHTCVEPVVCADYG
jgi:hypothetical protein